MDITEIKRILKGKWKYNLNDKTIICKQKEVVYTFENKDVLFFQKIIAHLKNGIPDPELTENIEQPTVTIPFETFHRVLRASITLYEPTITLTTKPSGLWSTSDHITFDVNHHNYSQELSVKIDPQQFYTVSRSFRNRERIRTKLLIQKDNVTMNCEFPWVNMTVKIPTIKEN